MNLRLSVSPTLAAIPLFRHELGYARRLIQAGDITVTAPYRIARWMDGHMQGRRVMVSGSYSFHFNDFTDIRDGSRYSYDATIVQLFVSATY